jgi:hypothetical protein
MASDLEPTQTDAQPSRRPWWRQRYGFENAFRRRPPHLIFWAALDAYIAITVVAIGGGLAGVGDDQPWVSVALLGVGVVTFAFRVRREAARISLVLAAIGLLFMGYSLGRSTPSGRYAVVALEPTGTEVSDECLVLPGVREVTPRPGEVVGAPTGLLVEVNGHEEARAVGDCLWPSSFGSYQIFALGR